MATAQQVQQFRLANQSLVLLAQNDLNQFLSSFDMVRTPDLVRDSLLEFFPELVTVYGDTAALLGADWYDELRDVAPSAASYRAVMASPPPLTQAAGSVRWGVGPLWAEGGAAAASIRLAGSLQRLVLQPGRDTVIGNAARDTTRVGYARIPRADCCAFCSMLASRGAVYNSKESAGGVVGRGVDAAATAGKSGGQGKGVKARGARSLGSNDYHDDCNCTVMPLFGNDKSGADLIAETKAQHMDVYRFGPTGLPPDGTPYTTAKAALAEARASSGRS